MLDEIRGTKYQNTSMLGTHAVSETFQDEGHIPEIQSTQLHYTGCFKKNDPISNNSI